MALITLNVNGRGYEMACDDGQEAHLQKLAEYIDEKVQNLAQSAGQAGEKRVLVMASLLIADELFEAYRQIHALGAREGDSGDAAAALEACATRLEAIAARLADA
jgi:cell division protein ZapA